MRDLKDLIHALSTIIINYHQQSTQQHDAQSEWLDVAEHLSTSTAVPPFYTDEDLTRFIDEATVDNKTRLDLLLYLKSVTITLTTLAKINDTKTLISHEESNTYDIDVQSEIVNVLKTLHKLYYHTLLYQTLSTHHAGQDFCFPSFHSGFSSTSSKIAALIFNVILKPLDITQHTNKKNLELQARNLCLQHKVMMLTEHLTQNSEENNTLHKTSPSASLERQTELNESPMNQGLSFRLFSPDNQNRKKLTSTPDHHEPKTTSFYVVGLGYGDFDR